VGFKIASVDSREDKIVYTGGITHEDYVRGRSKCSHRLSDPMAEADVVLVRAIDTCTLDILGQRIGRKDNNRMFPERQDVSQSPNLCIPLTRPPFLL
jgi:hypothetical protein